MTDPFLNLTPTEKQHLLAAPVYISLLAAIHDKEMDEKDKQEAIKITHLKTFSHDEVVSDYFKEVENNFGDKLDNLYKILPQDAAEREIAIREELHGLEELVSKLPEEYRQKMLHSLESYSWHVSKAHRNVSEDFFIPFKIKGLTA